MALTGRGALIAAYGALSSVSSCRAGPGWWLCSSPCCSQFCTTSHAPRQCVQSGSPVQRSRPCGRGSRQQLTSSCTIPHPARCGLSSETPGHRACFLVTPMPGSPSGEPRGSRRAPCPARLPQPQVPALQARSPPRAHAAGDDTRSTDRRTTACRAQLVSLTWRPERDRRPLLVLDTGRTAAVRTGELPRLDPSIDAALLLATLATRAGDRVDLLAYDRSTRASARGDPATSSSQPSSPLLPAPGGVGGDPPPRTDGRCRPERAEALAGRAVHQH